MPPSAADIRRAVLAQKATVARLFDDLRAGSLDKSGQGVTRDTYGPGEQFGYRVIEAHATVLGLERARDAASGANERRPVV